MKKKLFITGGLGNQMFQYALFLSLIQKGISAKIITSLFQCNRMHNGYMLERAFGIPDIMSMPYPKISLLLHRLIRSNYLPFLIYKEDEYSFCEDVFTTSKVYIDGYWIDERYFADIKETIQSAYSFKGIDQKNYYYAHEMQNNNSVSLHIRRGDYLNNPMYNVCDEHYYRNAIDYIKGQISDPMFYIFSDDPDWCKDYMKHMHVDYTIFDHNIGTDSYKDMFLMTQCKHNIIANSTFSWWGAWLGSRNNRIVVCPDKWIIGRDFNPCLQNWYHIS